MKDKDGKILSTKEISSKVLNRANNYFLEFWLMILNRVTNCPFWSIRRLFFEISGVQIGRKAVLHTGVRFFNPANVSVGEDSKIGYRTFLDGRAPLKIGAHVDIASEVMIYNSEHDLTSSTMKATEEPVIIEDYVFIGPRAIILPGVKISKGAVVAAGAVVTKNVAPKEIVAGIPAKKISERKIKNLNYNLGRAKLFQ